MVLLLLFFAAIRVRAYYSDRLLACWEWLTCVASKRAAKLRAQQEAAHARFAEQEATRQRLEREAAARREMEMGLLDEVLKELELKGISQALLQRRDAVLERLVTQLRLAEQHTECPICYEELYTQRCVVFTQADSGQRTCRHLLHEACSLLLQQHNSLCPVCRAPFGAFRVVPLITEDAQAWFRCVDFEGTGQLTRAEVAEVLTSHFPLDRSKVEVALPLLWPSWDLDGSGFVTEAEFFTEGALLDFVRIYLLPILSPQASVACGDEERGWQQHDQQHRISQGAPAGCPSADDELAAPQRGNRDLTPARAHERSGRADVQPVPPASMQVSLSPCGSSADLPQNDSQSHQDTPMADVTAAAPPEVRTMPEEVARV